MLQLIGRTPSMRWRVAVSAAIGIGSGTLCWFLMRHFHQDAADFRWALHLARCLLANQSPYDTPREQYPVTAALFALPFLGLPPEAAAGCFWGVSSFLLALGLTRGGYHRLLVFLAYPYWAGMIAVQWSTIIAASAFFPILLPAAMAKPQVGVPVIFTRLTRKGLLACAVAVALSLIWKPSWPALWFHQWQNYEHFVPLLVLPGPILLLALVRYRDRDAQLLLWASAMPQRWFFDTLTLWLIPRTRKQLLFTVLLSWGAGILRWNYTPHSFTQVGRWAVTFLYLPMLALIFWNRKKAAEPVWSDPLPKPQ
jgi:hypothetical protein